MEEIHRHQHLLAHGIESRNTVKQFVFTCMKNQSHCRLFVQIFDKLQLHIVCESVKLQIAKINVKIIFTHYET